MLLALRAIGSGVEHFLHTGTYVSKWEDAKQKKPLLKGINTFHRI
jgi:hypothetical protein